MTLIRRLAASGLRHGVETEEVAYDGRILILEVSEEYEIVMARVAR